MGIELKTKTDKSLQTLFSRTPSRYARPGARQGFFESNCYQDKRRGRRALYTSFTSKPDPLGFALQVQASAVRVVRRGQTMLEYDAEVLEAALLSKHTQTAFLSLRPIREDGREMCVLQAAKYCKWPSVIRFLRLIAEGGVYLDLTMSETSKGKVKDHGFLWRIRGDALDRLYLATEELDLERR